MQKNTQRKRKNNEKIRCPKKPSLHRTHITEALSYLPPVHSSAHHHKTRPINQPSPGERKQKFYSCLPAFCVAPKKQPYHFNLSTRHIHYLDSGHLLARPSSEGEKNARPFALALLSEVVSSCLAGESAYGARAARAVSWTDGAGLWLESSQTVCLEGD